MEKRQQLRSNCICGLASDEGRRCRGWRVGAKPESRLERRIAQLGTDNAAIRQQMEVAVREGFESRTTVHQIIGRTTPGEQQTQDLLIDLRPAGGVGGGGAGPRKSAVGLCKIGAVPDLKPVSD